MFSVTLKRSAGMTFLGVNMKTVLVESTLGDDSFSSCDLGIVLIYFLKEGLTLQRGNVIVL